MEENLCLQKRFWTLSNHTLSSFFFNVAFSGLKTNKTFFFLSPEVGEIGLEDDISGFGVVGSVKQTRKKMRKANLSKYFVGGRHFLRRK